MTGHERYTIDHPDQAKTIDDAELLANARAALYRNVWSPLARGVLAEVVDRFDREHPPTDETPCRVELWSWDYFRPGQTDPYWMRCDLVGPHEQHENSETGAKWPSIVARKAEQ